MRPSKISKASPPRAKRDAHAFTAPYTLVLSDLSTRVHGVSATGESACQVPSTRVCAPAVVDAAAVIAAQMSLTTP